MGSPSQVPLGQLEQSTHKLALGYRRLRKAVPGEWLRRKYLGADDRRIGHYKQEPIGKADDFADADGVNIFDFSQAQLRASVFELRICLLIRPACARANTAPKRGVIARSLAFLAAAAGLSS